MVSINWDEYNIHVHNLREKIRTSSIDVVVIDKDNDIDCYFCFEEKGKFNLLASDGAYPIGNRCYEDAQTHVYLNGKAYEVN